MSNFITVPIAFFFQPVNCVHWLWQNLRQVTLAMLLNIAETASEQKESRAHEKSVFGSGHDQQAMYCWAILEYELCTADASLKQKESLAHEQERFWQPPSEHGSLLLDQDTQRSWHPM